MIGPRHEQECHEVEVSARLSPEELVVWHGMGARVHPARMGDLERALCEVRGGVDRLERRRRAGVAQREAIRAAMARNLDGPRPLAQVSRQRPVVVWGRWYADATAAGRALRVAPSSVRYWISRGKNGATYASDDERRETGGGGQPPAPAPRPGVGAAVGHPGPRRPAGATRKAREADRRTRAA